MLFALVLYVVVSVLSLFVGMLTMTTPYDTTRGRDVVAFSLFWPIMLPYLAIRFMYRRW